MSQSLQTLRAAIDVTIDELIPHEDTRLQKAAKYSLDGGKRLRPLLTLSVLDAFSVPLELGLVPACSLEFVHTYSLIHDDLPCMDDDDERRGRPSLHRAFDEHTAVLTGDLLLTLSFEVLTSGDALSPSCKMELVRCLAKRGGASGLIGGQMLDLTETMSSDWEEIQMIYQKKTGALFSTALEFGGIMSNTDRNTLKKIGNHLGMAFQLIDDILDEDGAAALLDQATIQTEVDSHYHTALEEIHSLDRPTSALEELAGQIVHRTV